MFFHKFPGKKGKKVSRSPQQLAAARRKVKKEKERYELFPELIEIDSVETYLNKKQEYLDKIGPSSRNYRAEKWREARRKLNDLPAIKKAGILRYWQAGVYPGTPSYLLGLIHQVNNWPGFLIWSLLKERRLFQLVGQRRLEINWKRYHSEKL